MRWCLFAEPVHVARGEKVHLEAVLANEDALAPGEYPARLQVVGPDLTRVLDRTVTVTIPAPDAAQEPPLAQPVLAEDVAIDGPPGKYRFLATFLRGRGRGRRRSGVLRDRSGARCRRWKPRSSSGATTPHCQSG